MKKLFPRLIVLFCMVVTILTLSLFAHELVHVHQFKAEKNTINQFCVYGWQEQYGLLGGWVRPDKPLKYEQDSEYATSLIAYSKDHYEKWAIIISFIVVFVFSILFFKCYWKACEEKEK